MVQLKDTFFDLINGIIGFQFLMVQLKDKNALQELQPNEISIPYGSIKSIRKTVSDPVFNDISIPYGSIKSCQRLDRNGKASYFNSLWFN